MTIRGYKSLIDTRIEFTPVTFLFGLLGAGKSSILRSMMVLREMSGRRTVAEALALSKEQEGGNLVLFPQKDGKAPCSFSLESDVMILGGDMLRYRIGVAVDPRSRAIKVVDEYLTGLNRQFEPKGVARIERQANQIKIRRRVKKSPPYLEELGLAHALLGDPRLSGRNYPEMEAFRAELAGWRFYSLGNLLSRRQPARDQEVNDIGVTGEFLLPFLRRLQIERPGLFQQLQTWLGNVVCGVGGFDLHVDEKYGSLHLTVNVKGHDIPEAGLPEGLLKALALLAVMLNPWGSRVIALDEPENGLDPRCIDRLGEALLQLGVEQDLQVIVATHSPWLCESVLAQAEAFPGVLSLLYVQAKENGTEVVSFEGTGPLFGGKELSDVFRPED